MAATYAATKLDIYIEEGADYSETFTWSDAPKSATNYTAKMTIKQEKNLSAEIEMTDTDYLTLAGAIGAVTIAVALPGAEVTPTYNKGVYDILLEDAVSGALFRTHQGMVTNSLAVSD